MNLIGSCTATLLKPHSLVGKALRKVGLWKANVVVMSDYYHSRDQTSKSGYLEKHAILGLDEKYDPYATCNRGNFEENMAPRPQVEFGHMFC